jgi:transcription elongation GreA/GreB family factor
MKTRKESLIGHLTQLLNHKVAEADRAIAAAIDSRNNDTKSSAGDKYETGREMIQIEINKFEEQKGKALVLQQDLSKIEPHKVCSKAEFGSLIATDTAHYFLSIGLGKLEFEGEVYYAISMASPIGMALKDKAVGDRVMFQGREIRIREIG